MNRPKVNECFIKENYYVELEMYCEYLEHKYALCSQEKLISTNAYLKEINRLNKAIDKACKILEFNDKSSYCDKPKTKEQWKAWLMKDE